MMRLEYRLTLNEYLAAIEADGKARNPWFLKSSLSWCSTICGIIIALISVFFDIIFSIFMFLLAIFISPPISKRFYRWKISGHYKNDPRLHECLTVDLNENSIQFTSENSTAKIKWEGFDYFIEADDVFNLYPSKTSCHIIPKRAFSNSEQLDSFRNILSRKINNDHKIFSAYHRTIRNYYYIALIVVLLALTGLFYSGRDRSYWVNLGNDLYAENKYEEALDSYNKALDIDPKSANAWNNRGRTLRKLKRYKEALASFDNALDIDPDSSYAWNGRGFALGELKRYEESLAAYEKVLDIDPDSSDAWHNRGDTLSKLKRYEESLASYNKALDIDPAPGDPYTWNNRGNALRKLKRDEEALAAYDKALEIYPEYVNAWYNRGNALRSLKRYEDALDSYDKALDIDPEIFKAWYNRGLTLESLKRYEDALDSYDKALDIDPNAQFVINDRQKLLTELGLSQ